MNFIKAERQIFNAMVKGDRVCFFPVDDKNIFVTPDGYMGYIFPVSTISFNAGRLTEFKPFEIAELVKPENQLTLTYDFRRIGSHDKRMYRRLKADGKNVFVNDAFLTNFQNPKFWQNQNDSISIVVVTETGTDLHQNIPVGVVLPLKAPDWVKDDYFKEGDI